MLSPRVLTYCAVSLGILACAALAEQPGPLGAARNAIDRTLPGRAQEFDLELIAAEDGRDVFEIDAVAGRVTLRGTTAGSLATAFHWYLKYTANAHISWCGNQLDVAAPLPSVPQRQRMVSPYRFRYYLNYTTFSYSMAWWDWARWEREIDWMALNGINTPLALTGHEAVVARVYRELGLSDEEIAAYLPGPAFLAWGWLGNLEGWGGPLPAGWIEGQCELQRKILARERELGMRPILPAFAGHVPAALGRHFPQARVFAGSGWNGFPPTYYLDPTDPLFERIATTMMRVQRELYGGDGLYAADPFNEMTAGRTEPAYVAAVGEAVCRGMTAADPDALWFLQGWSYEPWWRPLLEAVPADRLVLLDLWGEVRPKWQDCEAFHGQSWVLGFVQNFGANDGLYGRLDVVAALPPHVLAHPDRGRLCGLGLFMEGLGHNPIVYDLATEMMWRATAPPLDEWVAAYVTRRYGRAVPAALEAWQILTRSAYATHEYQEGTANSILAARPALRGVRARQFTTTVIPYDPAAVARAWELLLSCADELGDCDTYRYDVVDVTRQVLADLAQPLYRELVQAYREQDAQRVRAAGQRLLDLLADLDELLGTRREFLLGPWLADARAWGATPAEQDLLEWNARTQITLWGPVPGPADRLRDYANRHWHGLIGSFYAERWRQYVDFLAARCPPRGNPQ